MRTLTLQFGLSGLTLETLRKAKAFAKSKAILERLGMRCVNKEKKWMAHRHVEPVSGKARKAEQYPPILLKAILMGLKDEMEEKGLYSAEGGPVFDEESWLDPEVMQEHCRE